MNLYGIEISVEPSFRLLATDSNWTFMELKFRFIRIIQYITIDSNWTFMELKSLSLSDCQVSTPYSNWTFMELKFIKTLWKLRALSILIEPLWNWNINICLEVGYVQLILIEPLWNWNNFKVRLFWKDKSF